MRNDSVCCINVAYGALGFQCFLFCFALLTQVCCQKVAETASAEGGRQRWLAILYDEVCCLSLRAPVLSIVCVAAGVQKDLGRTSFCRGEPRCGC